MFNGMGLLSNYSFAPGLDDSAYPQPLRPPRGILTSTAMTPMMVALQSGQMPSGGSSSHPPGAIQRKTSQAPSPEPTTPTSPAEFMQPEQMSANPVAPMTQPQGAGETSSPSFMDQLGGGLRNLYGNGGAGDALISVGMGLLSQRGVGRGLAAGFQNAAAMSDLANQRQRQATLDKLAQGREERQASWNSYLQRRQGEQDALELKKFDADQGYRAATLNAAYGKLNQPELVEKRLGPGQAQKFWIKPGETEGTPFGQPYSVTNPEDGLISNDAVESMAGRILAGEKNVLTGLGRGAQGAENIRRVQEAITKRNPEAGAILGKQIEAMGQGAEARTLGTQEANAISAGTEALGALKIGRDASSKLARGNYVPVNMAIQAWEKGTSNPELAAYGQAMHTIANTYARAVNPKGLPHERVVSDTVKMLSSAQGPEALTAMLDVMEQEIGMAQKSPAQARQVLKDIREGREPTPMSTATPLSGNGWRVR